MKFINLTPHQINETVSGQSFAPSGNIARVAVSFEKIREEGKIPLYSPTYGEIEGLPSPQPDTMYIVSGMVLAAAPADRADLVAPGDLVRDEKGQPVGCKGFEVA